MRAAWFVPLLLVLSTPLAVVASAQPLEHTTVKMWIPAVGQREDGSLFGVASSLEVTMQSPGSGQVYLSSRPLTQIDMQGSARLAIDTASAITGKDASNADFLFKVETASITIGGPSAGGAMAVAVAALLEGWTVRDDVVMTGMVNPDGSIGPIGGVLQKLEAADSVGAKRFLVPLGQSTVVVTVQEQDPRTGEVVQREEIVDVKAVGHDEYGIDVEEVADLYDAVAPFTGLRLVRPEPTTDPLQGQRYGGITTRLAQNLTNQVAQRLSDIRSRYDAVQSEVTRPSDRQTIEGQLNLAAERFVSARAAQNESKQYLASSLAFQGLVALDYAEALVAYFESSEEIADYAATYLSATDAVLQDVSGDIRVAYPIATSQLDSQAGAEQRLLEARELQAQASLAAQSGNLGNTLQASSFARERAESARWWWSIGVDVASTSPRPTLSEQSVQALWLKYRETAQLEIAYASLIAQDAPGFAAAQQAYQRSLVAVEDGFYAAGLLELVQALAQTNTALVALAGEGPVRQRLDAMAASAAYQIELAEAQGSPPVYAIALLELANSRAEDDPSGAFSTYSTARILARASLQAAGIRAPEPGVEAVRERNLFGLDDVASPSLLGLALVMGIGAILLLLAWGSAPRAQSPPSGAYVPRREPTKTSIPFPDEPDEPTRGWLPLAEPANVPAAAPTVDTAPRQGLGGPTAPGKTRQEGDVPETSARPAPAAAPVQASPDAKEAPGSAPKRRRPVAAKGKTPAAKRRRGSPPRPG